MRALRRASSNADIDLDRYAEIAAHVRHFPEDKADEVVRRLGVSPRGWQAAAARWARTIEASADAGDAVPLQRYSAALARTRRRLASLQPRLESLGPLPEPEPDDAPPDPLPAPALDHLPVPSEPVVAVPSYLSGPSADGPAVPALTLPIAAPAAQELPFKPTDGTDEEAVERAPAHATAPQGHAPDKASPLGATDNLGQTSTNISDIVRRPLPFAGSLDAAPPLPAPASRMPRGMQRFADVEGTQLAPEGVESEAGPAWMPRGMKGFADVEGTQLAPEGAAPEPALPFDPPAAPSPAAPSQAPPAFSVQQYASVRVEIDLDPSRTVDTLARYGITSAQLAALDVTLGARIAANPQLRAEWDQAYSSYRAWLRASAGRGPA